MPDPLQEIIDQINTEYQSDGDASIVVPAVDTLANIREIYDAIIALNPDDQIEMKIEFRKLN